MGLDPNVAGNRDAWLTRRRQGIGSTDAAAILGKSRWKTPLHVYLDKRGELIDEDSEPKRWGRLLENVVATAYEEHTGNHVVLPAQSTYVHEHHPELLCSLDRIVQDGHEDFILECKTSETADGWGQEGSDDIPDEYLIQVQHQMMVTGYKRADVAVLIAGNRFKRYIVQSSPGIQTPLLRIELDFWKKIQRCDAPDLEWSHPETGNLLKRMYGVDESYRIALEEEAKQMVREYLICHEEVKGAEQKKERMKLELLALMKRAAFAELDDGTTLHRKTINRAGYAVAPTSYVAFSIKASQEMKNRAKPY